MKRVRYGLVGAAAVLMTGILAPAAQSQDVEVSGNVAIVSDYVFRGISQTSEEPAIQGGFDVGLPHGLYVGTWGSSVNFGPGFESAMEIDGYAGIAPSVGGFDLDAGLIYYAYPGSDSDNNFDFLELYAGIARTFGLVTAGLSGAYSPEFFGETGTGLYGQLAASLGLPNTPLTLDGSLGMQSIELGQDYMDWGVGAAADVVGLSVGARVTGTDLDDEDCTDICSTRFVVSVSRSL